MHQILKSILVIGSISFSSNNQVSTRPDIAHESKLPKDQKELYAIQIEGHSPASASNFAMSLQRGPHWDGREIPLHMIFHLNTGEIHINSFNLSEDFKKSDVHKCPFKAGQKFSIQILYETDHYTITVNGHNMTYKSAVTKNVGNYLTVFNSARIRKAFWLDEIPLRAILPEHFQGVIVVGRIPKSATRFDVNLFQDPAVFYKNTTLHLSFRVYKNMIVANSKAVSFGNESKYNFTFDTNQAFAVRIFDDGKDYQIDVLAKLRFSYTPQNIDNNIAKYISVRKELEVTDVFFYGYQNNSLDFNQNISTTTSKIEIIGIMNVNISSAAVRVTLQSAKVTVLAIEVKKVNDELEASLGSRTKLTAPISVKGELSITIDKSNVANSVITVSVNGKKLPITSDTFDRLLISGDIDLSNIITNP